MRIKTLGIIAGILTLILTTQPALAEPGQSASVVLSIPAATASLSSETAVPISILTGGTEVGALQFDLVYDSKVLEALKVEPGPRVSGLTDFRIKTPGRVRIALATSETLSEGEIFVVTFKALSEGQTTLAAENARAWERATSFETTVTATPGAVTVNAPFPVFVIAGLGGLGLVFLIIVTAVIVMLRRKRRATVPAHATIPGTSGAPAWPGIQPVQPITVAVAPPGVRCTCGQIVAAGSRFCPSCGATIANTGSYCSACGGQVNAGARFCRTCGAPTA